MLSYKQAEQVARVWIQIRGHGKWDLMLQHTITKPYGWVFFYESAEYIKTENLRYGLIGNAPFIVDRIDGQVRVTGTGRPIAHYLAAYEASLPPARLQMTPDPPSEGS
jgi:hypothetical protein